MLTIKGEATVFEHNLLFRCRKCDWWAIGIHHSDEAVSREDLDNAQFDVKCTSNECGWSGNLRGSEAYKSVAKSES